MKKWLYFIAPIAAVGLFLFFYFSHVEGAKKAALEKKARIEAADKLELERKAALEARARADATKKAEDRAIEEAKKENDRITKWNDQGKKIQDETDESVKTASEHTAKIGALEKELASLRKQKEQGNRNYLEATRELELTRIARRNAELEIQRLTELMIRKADESALAVAQIPAAPAPAK